MMKVPWADPLEKFFRPMQGVVSFGLIAVILVSLYMLLSEDTLKRTAWFVWVVSP
jgi:hypothetical protein